MVSTAMVLHSGAFDGKETLYERIASSRDRMFSDNDIHLDELFESVG